MTDSEKDNFQPRLINTGDSEYRVVCGTTTIGRVRRSGQEWTAAIMVDGQYDPLSGNYRSRGSAVDDVMSGWNADRADEDSYAWDEPHQPGDVRSK